MTDRRSFTRSARLRRSSEIRAMFRSGTRRRCGSLDAYLRPAPDGRRPRVAVVVPKHGRSIVRRNSLGRRIREILRTGWLPAERGRPEPRDLLVRARAPAYDRSFVELRNDLHDCLDVAATC